MALSDKLLRKLSCNGKATGYLEGGKGRLPEPSIRERSLKFPQAGTSRRDGSTVATRAFILSANPVDVCLKLEHGRIGAGLPWFGFSRRIRTTPPRAGVSFRGEEAIIRNDVSAPRIHSRRALRRHGALSKAFIRDSFVRAG